MALHLQVALQQQHYSHQEPSAYPDQAQALLRETKAKLRPLLKNL